MNPTVSVILPVYNAELYIKESIDSVLNQSFKDFELLLFNDASTDGTEEILNNYTDSRIILFNSPENKGYLHYLNEGISLAKGKYIARMDADDICEIQRFEKQVDYLNSHVEIGVVGSSIQIFGNEKRIKHYPKTSVDCAYELLSRSCFAHPAVMFRKSVLIENEINYNSTFYTAEDYYLWVQLFKKTSFYNIKEVLLNYRVNPGSISNKRKKEQFELKNSIQLFALNEILGITLNMEQQNSYLAMLNPYQKLDLNWKTINDVFTKLEELPKNQFPFIDKFILNLTSNIRTLVFYNPENGIKMIFGYQSFKRKYALKDNIKSLSKLYIKAIFKLKSR